MAKNHPPFILVSENICCRNIFSATRSDKIFRSGIIIFISHPATLNSPAALLKNPAVDVRVRRGDNNISHWRCSRNKSGDPEVKSVDRKAH